MFLLHPRYREDFEGETGLLIRKPAAHKGCLDQLELLMSETRGRQIQGPFFDRSSITALEGDLEPGTLGVRNNRRRQVWFDHAVILLVL